MVEVSIVNESIHIVVHLATPSLRHPLGTMKALGISLLKHTSNQELLVTFLINGKHINPTFHFCHSQDGPTKVTQGHNVSS